MEGEWQENDPHSQIWTSESIISHPGNKKNIKNTRYLLLSTYYVQSTVLSTSHVIFLHPQQRKEVDGIY